MQLNIDDHSTTTYHPQANVKIVKFIFDKDIEWPRKLHLACLSSNMRKKKSTRYNAFQLMFAREFNHLPLLRLLNLPPEEQEDKDTTANEDWLSDLEHLRKVQ
ncbi:hypothetical protein LOD99_3922 [Oopsacas minuta]|uniref:Uncharacterized protein n=1 Tax=Oopsacas minuta TaxID=111878 RepID=A0AAV7JWM6_9METZ|nr:hypothetical protein LOD99_3922 [Oopsacas minuta]